MKRFGLVIAVAGFVSLSFATEASAIPKFRKAFEEKYIKSGDHPELAPAFKEAACNLCHVKGKPKSVHNSYGEVLEELIDGNVKERLDAAKEIGSDEKKAEEARIVEEFIAVLPKAEEATGEDGETYGARIKAGKLPVDLPPKDDEEDGDGGEADGDDDTGDDNDDN